MAQIANIKTQVLQQVYDPQGIIDETNFYKSNMGKPSQLSSKVTWLLGNEMFPILYSTEGMIFDYSKGTEKKGNVKELDDIQYEYPVITRTDKAAEIAVSSFTSTDRPGIGNSTFQIILTDNWIKRNYLIETPRRIQLMVQDDPTPVAQGYAYNVKIDPADATTFCPPSELVSGTLIVQLHTINPESYSRGTESTRVAPGKLKNQMTVLRKSHHWAGNASQMIMNATISIDGKEYTNWMDWDMWQFEYKWALEKENAIWYSRYNREVDSTIELKDIISGRVIPRGSGILEQIPNYYTYSKLTFKKLQQVIREALFGQGDMKGKTITLYTGTGGFQEFNNALKQGGYTEVVPAQTLLDNKFVTGTGYDLTLSGYFNAFYHIDGYFIKVKKTDFFDKGTRAMNSPLHPETNLPLESYRMVFIDDNDYDGQPNLQYVTQKGRQMLHGVTVGLTNMPKSYEIIKSGSDNLMNLSTDVDKSGYHRLSVCGVQIMRATGCIHLECTAGF